MRGTGAQSRLSLPWEPRPRHSRGRGEGLAGLEEGGQAAGAGEGPPGEPGWEGLPPPALSRKPPSASSANSQIIKPIYFSDKKKITGIATSTRFYCFPLTCAAVRGTVASAASWPAWEPGLTDGARGFRVGSLSPGRHPVWELSDFRIHRSDTPHSTNFPRHWRDTTALIGPEISKRLARTTVSSLSG